MAIGIRKKKDRPLYDRMLPEEQAVLDAPMPLDEQAPMRIGVSYLQGVPEDPGIDAEAAARQAAGITSVGPHFAAPPGMVMRNEAGRGTPLLRTDRPYWAPGMMAAAPPVAPVDDPELMAQLEAQQQQSLGVMDSKRMFTGGENSTDVEARRKEYMAGTNLADMREKRIGIQKERQAAVTEKAKDRMMSPQQRGMKQFIASVADGSDGGAMADVLLGPAYAQAKDRQADNSREDRKVDIAEQAAATDEARNLAIAEQAKRKQELEEIAAGLRPMPSTSPAFQQQAMKNAAPNMALDPKQLYSQVGPSLDMVEPATLPDAESARQTLGTLGLNEPLLQRVSSYSPNIMGFPTDLPSMNGLRNPIAESLFGLLSGGLIGTGTINALSEKPDAYAQRQARQSKAQQLIKLLLNQ